MKNRRICRSVLRFLAVVSVLELSSCASGMAMKDLPSETKDSATQVGEFKVQIFDINPQSLSEIRTAAPSIPPALLQNQKGPYRVGPFDVLVVTVWEHPELTQPLGQYRTDMAAGQLVDADGTMYFPYVGRVKVQGMTTTEIQTIVTTALSKLLQAPQVDIKVVGYRSQRLFVSGEVKTPGVVTVDDVPLSLPELLHRCGGLTPAADGSALRLVRGGQVYELDIVGLQAVGAPLDQILMQPGDQIRVPSSAERKAYLLGEVGKPSTIALQNGRSSLVQALAEAGGFDKLSADAGAVFVVRVTDSTSLNVYRLDGRDPLALAWADQFEIRPRDLVYVDATGLARWNRVVQQLLPTAQLMSSLSTLGRNSQLIYQESQ